MQGSASVALLTGGTDKPYALGLASALAARGAVVDFIGSDELDCSEIRAIPRLRFLNLRGDQREDAPLAHKIGRVVLYYLRLLMYVTGSSPAVLHILWNNRFELFDRTALMAYYRLNRKRVVLTAHNVNTAARNGNDSWLNRFTLTVQYRLCHHIFVHTDAMRSELSATFGIAGNRVTVIPFGINDTIPRTDLAQPAARQYFGLANDDRVLLFFGQIAPYKGLEYLVRALAALKKRDSNIRLLLAGKVKRGSEQYWTAVQQSIESCGISDRVVQRIGFIPDAHVEPFFKAADVVVIPYVDIFQSGVPFLAFSFGLPVIATDVGSLRDDITDETGLLCRPRDAGGLADAILRFYASPLYQDRGRTAVRIRQLAVEYHSWEIVAQRTTAVYSGLVPGEHRDVVTSSPSERA